MKSFALAALLVTLLASTPPPLYAQHDHDGDPEVYTAEIFRRGNVVEDTEQRFDGPQLAIMQVTSVPPDDSHKWFISIVTKPGCQACDRLKADFIRSPYLNCWANPEDRAASWAHYNVYNGEDATQVARWKSIRIQAYPTIIIQPPRNRAYGEPSTVVFQRTGYDGDPKALGAAIRSAVTRYAAKNAQHLYQGEANPPGDPTQEELAEDPAAISQTAPFPVPAPVGPIPSTFPPEIPPPDVPDGGRQSDPTIPGNTPPVLPWIVAGVAITIAVFPFLRRAVISELANEISSVNHSAPAKTSATRSRPRGRRT